MSFPKKPQNLVTVFLLLSFSYYLVHGDDKHALLALKKLITSDPFGFTSNWNQTDINPCSWTGITCDVVSNRVISLNLSNPHNSCSILTLSISPLQLSRNFSLNYPCLGFSPTATSARITGQLPPEIGDLSQLKALELGFNGFTGLLPAQIGRLKFLEVLDLGFNYFSGPVPDTIKNCTSLQVVNLGGNRFNGSVPVFDGSGLRVLALSNNLFSGAIPEELGDDCGSLEHVFLDGNAISDSIPYNLGNCLKLRTLILSSNLLQDDIPSSFGNLGVLEVLDLSRNFLSGNVPRELGNCENLRLLVLKNNYGHFWSRNFSGFETEAEEEEELGEVESNYFDGSLPDSITKLPNLEALWAPNLNLEGKFPQNWGSLNLKILNLAGNYFTGELPLSLGDVKGLYFLDVSSNNLTGLLPQQFSVPCMAVFNVSRNHLSGNIPVFLSNECSKGSLDVPNLYDDLLGFYSLFFYMNAVMGVTSYSFPLDGLPVLHDLSNNLFTGPMSAPLIHSKSFLRRPSYGFWLGGNKLEGGISIYSFDVCASLEDLILDISENKIVGELPPAVASNCKCLRYINLAGNSITGSVPRNFTFLDSLVNLNLSRNRLQGSIPSFIGGMKGLRFLSLSSNNFFGDIPPELAQLSALEVLDLSWNALSGEIPPDLAKLAHLTVLRLDHNNISGKIPPGFGNATSLTSFDVSFNNLSGSVPLNSSLISCQNVEGNPNLQPCRRDSSLTEWEKEHSGNISQQDRNNSPTGSTQKNNGGFSPIEIASITSASVIFSVLVVLVLFLVCMKKFMCVSVSGQGSGRKEVVTCNDIGVPLTYENVVRATGGFNIQNCIGSGGFGATYKAEIAGVVVAVKRLSVGRFQGVQQFDAEIRTLGRVHHPNLVKLLGYHLSESEMFLIYNYLPGGNLENFIQERSRRAVEWSMLHKIAFDIARALAYLHDECVPRVLHRDIKPSNILLDNNCNACLSDFGLARLLGTSETHATTDVAGTFGYVAPEYAMTCRVSDKADVYSYGVVLLELISDKKALDPSFSSYGNGFNIVGWASMLLCQGRACEFFAAGLWDSGPHGDLIEILHLGIKCTSDSLSSRPTMRQVAQKLKRIQPSTS